MRKIFIVMVNFECLVMDVSLSYLLKKKCFWVGIYFGWGWEKSGFKIWY